MSSELSHKWKKALVLNNCVKENHLCSFIVLRSTSLLIYSIRVVFRQKLFCSLGDFDNTWQHFWFPWLGKERYWRLARKTRDAPGKKSYSTQTDPTTKNYLVQYQNAKVKKLFSIFLPYFAYVLSFHRLQDLEEKISPFSLVPRTVPDTQ